MVVGRFGNDLPFHDQRQTPRPSTRSARTGRVARSGRGSGGPATSTARRGPGCWQSDSLISTVSGTPHPVGAERGACRAGGADRARALPEKSAALGTGFALAVPRSRGAPARVGDCAVGFPVGVSIAGAVRARPPRPHVGCRSLRLALGTGHARRKSGAGTQRGSGFASALASAALASWRLVRERDAVPRRLERSSSVDVRRESRAGAGSASPSSYRPPSTRRRARIRCLRTPPRLRRGSSPGPETNPLFGISAFVLPFARGLAA